MSILCAVAHDETVKPRPHTIHRASCALFATGNTFAFGLLVLLVLTKKSLVLTSGPHSKVFAVAQPVLFFTDTVMESDDGFIYSYLPGIEAVYTPCVSSVTSLM